MRCETNKHTGLWLQICSGYGPTLFGNRPVRTRMRGAVGGRGEKPLPICVFRTLLGHRFRSIVDTDSGRSWTLIPLDRGQPIPFFGGQSIRKIVDSVSGITWLGIPVIDGHRFRPFWTPCSKHDAFSTRLLCHLVLICLDFVN